MSKSEVRRKAIQLEAQDKWNTPAPAGFVYQCSACGRRGPTRQSLKDTSCVIHSELVKENP